MTGPESLESPRFVRGGDRKSLAWWEETPGSAGDSVWRWEPFPPQAATICPRRFLENNPPSIFKPRLTLSSGIAPCWDLRDSILSCGHSFPDSLLRVLSLTSLYFCCPQNSILCPPLSLPAPEVCDFGGSQIPLILC